MSDIIKNGVYPTMLTPFTEDNEIDYDGVLSILDYYAKSGVDGIFAVCQSSEMFFLSAEERLSLLKFIKANMPGGISLVASGNVSDDFDSQVKEARAFIDEGIDAYVFLSNRFAAADENDEVFLKNYESVLSRLPDVPLGIYECPYPYKRVVQPETLARCCEISNLSFIKDTCCDINLIRAKLKATVGTGLKIFNANGATFFESLKDGCAGYSGVMANFHPDLYKWLYIHADEESERVKMLADFLSFASTIELQQYPVNAKYHMSKCGVNIGIYTRTRDFTAFTDANRKEIDSMIETENRVRKAICG